MRALGFFCGFSMAFAVVVLAQEFITNKEVFTDIIMPLVLFMVGLLGWVLRNAYANLLKKMDSMEDDVVEIKKTIVGLEIHVDQIMQAHVPNHKEQT